MNAVCINGYISAGNHKISRNGKLFYESDQSVSFGEFTKSLYKSLELNYMKFFKMDNLCKIAFLSTEILFKDSGLKDRYKPEDIGIVLINSASSIDSDIKFQETISDKSNYFPNPSLFVYTLPNIMIGEISIKNNIKGENALFLFDNFEFEFLTDYINNLFINKKIQACLGGYINFDPSVNTGKRTDDYESFIFWVEQFQENGNTLQIAFNKENINNLYQNGRI